MLSHTVLFDLDGTLTDPKPGITRCIQYALSELGYKPPDANELLWCIGPPLKSSFSQLLQTSDDTLLEEAISLYRSRFSTIGLLRLSFVGSLRVIRRAIPEFQRQINNQLDINTYYSWLIAEISDLEIPLRQHRSNPRVVKKARSKFKSKKRSHRNHGTPRQQLSWLFGTCYAKLLVTFIK